MSAACWPGGSAIAAVAVTDFSGHRVRLAEPAQRIVALTPHLVENLFTAGLGGRMVGAVRYSDYPPAARDIPRVGGYRSLSLEAIVARRPDLVVAWAQSGTGDLIQRLRALDIPVYVDDPTHFDDIARALRDLGQLGGTQARADAAAERFSERMTQLSARYRSRAPVRTFYAVSVSPLITVSDQSMIGAAIRLCGGDNLFADAASAAPHISGEALIARDPEAIVSAQPNADDHAWTQAWRARWPGLQAVAAGHFVTVPRSPMSRPTVRMADAVTRLCQGLDHIRHEQDSTAQKTARPASSE